MKSKQAKRAVGLRLSSTLFILLLAACASSPNSQRAKPSGEEAAPTAVALPVQGLIATLEDEVRELPGGRIAWRTHWRLCWDAYPQAIGYELRQITAEGAPRSVRRQSERCLSMEAAAGENEKTQGLAHRDLLLALSSGQLAYRVRALLEGGGVSEWSRQMAVGKEAKPGRE